jgi:hypothetical protein
VRIRFESIRYLNTRTPSVVISLARKNDELEAISDAVSVDAVL